MTTPLDSEAQLAARAQVDPAFLGRLIDLGIIRRSNGGFVPGDVWVRILRSVEAAGVSMEAVAQALVAQDFDLSFSWTPCSPSHSS